MAAVLAAALGGCGASADGDVLTVFAASSLTGVFTTLERAFEREHPGVDVRMSYGGSSRLAEQIAEGAPADVFAAADEASMATVADAGLTDGRPTVFATNTLAIAVAKGNPERIHGLRDLARAGLTVVSCAAEAPCGRAAATVARRAGVRLRPASEEPDVKAVLTKVVAGEADAGLVYRTDVRVARTTVDGIGIPEAAAVPNRYPIAALREADDRALARRFSEFVVSEQRVLQRAGFGAP